MREAWNNKVFVILGRVFDIIVLSLLWVICSLPVITFIPSTAALYHSMTRAVRRDRGYALQEFFHSLKQNLRSGILLSLAYVAAVAVLYTCVDVANAVGRGTLYAKFYYAGTFALSVTLLYMTMFFIPVFSRFQMKTLDMFRLSLYLASKNVVRLIPWIISLLGCAAFCYIVPVLLAILPGLYAYHYSKTVEKILLRQMEEMGLLTEETKALWFYDPEDDEGTGK